MAQVTHYTTHEGGPWLEWKRELDGADPAHALRFDDGREWDVVGGWRTRTTFSTDTTIASEEYNILDRLGRMMFDGHIVPHGFEGKPLDRDLMLFIEEIIELFTAERHGELSAPSEHVPDITKAEEEAADLIIRVLTNAAERGWRIGLAVYLKHAFNLTRPYKHGKKF